MTHRANVFAYGSLVGKRSRDNRLSWAPASLQGWSRSWSHGIKTARGKACVLTVVPSSGVTIAGVLLESDAEALRALDDREQGYTRKEVDVVIEGGRRSNSWLYVGDSESRARKEDGFSIWLSYLRVVLAGYFELGGPSALEEFYRTTDGWDMPILTDDDDPKYSRAFQLEPKERDEIDRFLVRHHIVSWPKAVRE